MPSRGSSDRTVLPLTHSSSITAKAITWHVSTFRPLPRQPGCGNSWRRCRSAATAGASTADARSLRGSELEPGAEFKGISTIGLVIEDLSAQSTRCGLVQTAIEGLVYKHLTDGGLQVRRNADDDTYVYVNIKTATVADGVCVSRYDVFLTTHTAAKLSYQPRPSSLT